MEIISQDKIMEVLNWAYDKALTGVAGSDSSFDLADEYLKTKGTRVDQVNALIRWQNTKAGAAGFVTGLGGLATMPIAVPANLASVILIQIRMIAAIEILRDFGILLGKKMTQIAISKISSTVITKINQTIGLRLITKTGTSGLINLSKVVPFVGGVVGGVFDATMTNTIGNIARDIFITSEFD